MVYYILPQLCFFILCRQDKADKSYLCEEKVAILPLFLRRVCRFCISKKLFIFRDDV